MPRQVLERLKFARIWNLWCTDRGNDYLIRQSISRSGGAKAKMPLSAIACPGSSVHKAPLNRKASFTGANFIKVSLRVAKSDPPLGPPLEFVVVETYVTHNHPDFWYRLVPRSTPRSVVLRSDDVLGLRALGTRRRIPPIQTMNILLIPSFDLYSCAFNSRFNSRCEIGNLAVMMFARKFLASWRQNMYLTPPNRALLDELGFDRSDIFRAVLRCAFG